MNARTFQGTTPIARFPDDNRGVAYGDGLFETLRVHRGVAPWWTAHWARLALTGRKD